MPPLNESAQSLFYTSGCPAVRVHRRLSRDMKTRIDIMIDVSFGSASYPC